MCIWKVTITTEKRGKKETNDYECFAGQAHAAVSLCAGRDKKYVISASVRRIRKNMSWEEYKAQKAEKE